MKECWKWTPHYKAAEHLISSSGFQSCHLWYFSTVAQIIYTNCFLVVHDFSSSFLWVAQVGNWLRPQCFASILVTRGWWSFSNAYWQYILTSCCRKGSSQCSFNIGKNCRGRVWDVPWLSGFIVLFLMIISKNFNFSQIWILIKPANFGRVC